MSQKLVKTLWGAEGTVPVYFIAQRGVRHVRLPQILKIASVAKAEVAVSVLRHSSKNTSVLVRNNPSMNGQIDVAARLTLGANADPTGVARVALLSQASLPLALEPLPPYLRFASRLRALRRTGIDYTAQIVVPFVARLPKTTNSPRLALFELATLRTLWRDADAKETGTKRSFSPTLLYDTDLAQGDVTGYELPDYKPSEQPPEA